MASRKVSGRELAVSLPWVGLAAVVLSASAVVLAGGGWFGGHSAAGPPGRPPTGPPPGAPSYTPAYPPALVASVPVGTGPIAGAVDLANGWVYVANAYSDNVTVLNGTSVVGTVDLTANLTGTPLYVTYDSLNGYVYVVDRYDNELPGWGAVNVLNGTSVVATVPVGARPTSAVFDPANGNVYVTNEGGSNVSVLHGTAVVAAVPVGRGPCAGAYDPVHFYVYVANCRSANVSLLFGTSLVGSVPAGTGPASVAFDPEDGYVYVANNASNNATVYSDVSPIANVPTGLDPSFAAYDAYVGGVGVADTNSSTVTVLNGTSAVATVPVVSGPVWLGPGPFPGYSFVAGESADAVSLLQGGSVIATVPVGSLPAFGVADPVHQLEYILNSGSNNVSVFALAYPVTFNETGLAPGVSWSVTLGARTLASTSPSIGFVEPTGTYAYSVPSPPGYTFVGSDPASPITVTNLSVVVNVTFAPVPRGTWELTFVETGLPTGCNRSGGWGWGPEQLASQCCRSSPLAWSVTVDGVTRTTTNTTLAFPEPNGVHNYTVHAPTGYVVRSAVPPSPVTIAGANLTVNVTFVRGCASHPLTLTFVESGLPRWTVWCVTVNGTHCSSGNEIVIAGLSPGTYAFNVSPVHGYTARPASGSVDLTDRNATVFVRFTGSGGRCGG